MSICICATGNRIFIRRLKLLIFYLNDKFKQLLNTIGLLESKIDKMNNKIDGIIGNNNNKCLCDRIIAIIKKYNLDKCCIMCLLSSNAWVMEDWDDLCVFFEFWRQSEYLMMVKLGVSNIKMLHKNKHEFRSQLQKQLNNYVKQLHLEWSLIYRHKAVDSEDAMKEVTENVKNVIIKAMKMQMILC